MYSMSASKPAPTVWRIWCQRLSTQERYPIGEELTGEKVADRDDPEPEKHREETHGKGLGADEPPPQPKDRVVEQRMHIGGHSTFDRQCSSEHGRRTLARL